MIIRGMFDLISNLINLIPFDIPELPDQFNTALQLLFDGIKSSLGIIDMFLDLKFWLSCAVVMIVIYNIKHIYNGIIFLINLIPGMSVSYWK